MSLPEKSTIVRVKNRAAGAFFRYAEHLAPRRAGRMALDLWFSAPPRMAELPVPPGGEAFEVEADGHVVRGSVWEAGGFETGAARLPQPPGDRGARLPQPPGDRGARLPEPAGDGAARLPEPAGDGGARLPHRAESPRTVYLVHGWGGRGGQFGVMVEPLVQAGYRVVMFDAPAHGESDHGPAGPRRTNGVEFARALDAVFCRFGPAEAVVAHSLGTIATYLALRFGWLGTQRLVFVAPMVESISLFDQFQAALGFGRRTRRAFDQALLDWVGIPVEEFDARFQAGHVDPVPTLVITDRDDRQTAHADVADFARTIDAPLVTTEGLGHRKVLRDPEVVRTVVEFVSGAVAADQRQLA